MDHPRFFLRCFPSPQVIGWDDHGVNGSNSSNFEEHVQKKIWLFYGYYMVNDG
jgi:hypothetical protein